MGRIRAAKKSGQETKKGSEKMICKKCNDELAYCPYSCVIRALYVGTNDKKEV